MSLKHKLGFFFMVALCFFCGCHPGVREEGVPMPPLKKLTLGKYPVFMDTMGFQGMAQAVDNSLVYFKRVPPQRQYAYEKEIYSAAHMVTSLEIFKAFLETGPSAKALNDFIRSRFLVYEAAGNAEAQVLFTGYYEPTYAGRLQKSDEYQYPVYSKPADLLEIDLSLFSDTYKGHKRLVARVNEPTKRVVPYYSRQQINALKDFHERSIPLAWLKSRVDRFFLEIQGSGRVDLGDGELMRVHYAVSNGKAYRSVGRYLMDNNEILKENMSMQAIRTWLEQHPERMDEVLDHNESFVFFQEEKDGPYGSIGVKLTALRSLATDSSLFPKGALCFMQAQLPDKTTLSQEWENVSFFVMNQDTGGAIKGPARADLFCGNGAYAEFTAGHMNKYGKLFFLVLKPDKE